MHAPLLDPGGVLHARQSASRTAAFRPLETVGFPLRTPLRAILLSTTILISGLHHAACILAPSSFVPPLLGVHVEFATDRLAKLWSGGTCTVPGAHPLGNNNQFHGFSPTPKVSGLPWRDHCFVRLVTPFHGRATGRNWGPTGAILYTDGSGRSRPIAHWCLVPGC